MENFAEVAPVAAIIAVVCIGGWVLTTWMRIKNGYPLDGSWGQAVYPKSDQETTDFQKALNWVSEENAQLRAELGSVKDRLATLERIITDGGYVLDQQIESLRDRAN